MCGRLGNSGLEEQQAAVLNAVVSIADDIQDCDGAVDRRKFESLRGLIEEYQAF